MHSTFLYLKKKKDIYKLFINTVQITHYFVIKGQHNPESTVHSTDLLLKLLSLSKILRFMVVLKKLYRTDCLLNYCKNCTFYQRGNGGRQCGLESNNDTMVLPVKRRVKWLLISRAAGYLYQLFNDTDNTITRLANWQTADWR